MELDYGPGMEYFKNEGKSFYANRGLIAEGLYTQEQIERINAGDPAIARSGYGTVRAGDIKYTDLNKDGVINDHDMTTIGNSIPKATYSITVDVSWKNFNLFANLTARTGVSGQLGGLNSNSTNYYWAYGGTMKYPAHMVGRWAYDPSYGLDTRATATYPRLSSTMSENNYRASTFWKYDGSYVTMPLLQVTYKLPKSAAKAMYMKNAMVFLRGQNLFVLGPNAREMQLNVASEPQMRWYHAGVKLEF
jgi:hypothetical protein